MTCPDCATPIPAIGKHVHRCRPQQSYVTSYDGQELPGFYRTEPAAWEALNNYVWDLFTHGLIVEMPAQQLAA